MRLLKPLTHNAYSGFKNFSEVKASGKKPPIHSFFNAGAVPKSSVAPLLFLFTLKNATPAKIKEVMNTYQLDKCFTNSEKLGCIANLNLLNALLVDKQGWDKQIYDAWFDTQFKTLDCPEFLAWVENVQSLPNASDKDHPGSVFYAHIRDYYKNEYLVSKEIECFGQYEEKELISNFMAVLTWNGYQHSKKVHQ